MAHAAIVTPHITTGAAVSSDVLGMRSVLERAGQDVCLFADSSDLPDANVQPINRISDFLANTDDILIYHHSIGWDPAIDLLKGTRCRRVVKYHNVTPSSAFQGVSVWHEQKCRQGRQQLEEIAAADCDLYLSDSNYNQDELVVLGVEQSKCAVVPPFHEVDQLIRMEGDLETLDRYRDGRAMVLCVSRIAPHKGHLEVLKAFASYHHGYDSTSRLVIVGREEEAFRAHSNRLRELIKFLFLDEHVVFTGEVPDSVLRSFYLLGNVFASASEHEGFGMPFVEAMATKMPIVAYNSSAIPETVGSAGIVLDNRDPEAMAEALNLLAADEAMNVAFGNEGKRRFDKYFSSVVIESGFIQALRNIN